MAPLGSVEVSVEGAGHRLPLHTAGLRVSGLSGGALGSPPRVSVRPGDDRASEGPTGDDDGQTPPRSLPRKVRRRSLLRLRQRQRLGAWFLAGGDPRFGRCSDEGSGGGCVLGSGGRG
ncbi:hypothetical protein NDU88_004826 [Pleurodeles waltl]|uniref:Uncharacterized protein n=1 Tax=Pleurodeles waltl TaxID=8319 RepID=A0AAV7TSI0_PLEWA|nr:hypothetical protein NDU88_004826 [Pleurodeles waltl]